MVYTSYGRVRSNVCKLMVKQTNKQKTSLTALQMQFILLMSTGLRKPRKQHVRLSWAFLHRGTEVASSETDRLVGLVVGRPPRERKIPGSNPACAGIFSGSSHTSDLKIGTPVATLPGAWRYRVSTGTGRPGVSILWLGEIESWICNFYLSVAARKLVWADPSLRYTRMLLGRQATKKQTNSENCTAFVTVCWQLYNA